MTPMMRNDFHAPRRRFLSIMVALPVAAAAALFPVAAGAQSLNALRASGAVGEGYDGFARVRKAGGGARSVVDAVNAKRRAIYAERAKEQGTTADQVGRVYARQILGKAPAGTWFLKESGKWVRK
ncbi:MAG: YdbL family protein [Proteobacteria bacterium]|nr:YdbL family protein [Pseudomonadota bacterium]